MKLELEEKAMQTQLPAKVRTRVKKEAGRASCEMQETSFSGPFYTNVSVCVETTPKSSVWPARLLAAFTGLPLHRISSSLRRGGWEDRKWALASLPFNERRWAGPGAQ